MLSDQGSSTADFGDLLFRYRVAAGLSREALAERAGLSATGIGALERGQRRAPHADTLRRLSEALQLSPEDSAALSSAVVRHRAPHLPPATAFPVTGPPSLIAPLTPLIGRGWDLAVVCGLLRVEDTRLVTLTGPGGVGKTRLALAVAEHLSRELPEPVLMVDLAPIQDPKLVMQAIADQLALPSGREHSFEGLALALENRRLLILLDNFEQLMPAAGDIPALLAAAPGLRLLVTSRSPLGLRVEHVYPVPPLELPDLRRLPSPEELAQIPAVSLFLARAQAVSPAFELTEENALAVAELCVHLDGLPLAIKLAAARMQVLSPQMVLDRLGQRLSLLRWDARDTPERQHTLEAAIAWSYDLLSPGEQALFRRIGVFVGGFTIEAAEELMDAMDGTKADVLEALSSLVESSLVRVQAEPSRHYRYGMLESIREYALERLAESDELEAASRAHARYFIHLIDQHETERLKGDERSWSQLQPIEIQNLLMARQWLTQHPDPLLELRLAMAPSVYWILGGNLEARQARLESALETIKNMKPEEADDFLRSWITLGDTLALLGDLDRAGSLLSETLVRARALGDDASTLACLISLGWCRVLSGDYKTAERDLQEGLALADVADDKLQKARAQTILGELARMRGQPEIAIAWLEGALSGLRALGDRVLAGAALTVLALVRAGTKDLAGASAHLLESVENSRHTQNPWLLNVTAERTALVSSEIVDKELLAELLGASDGLKRKHGVRGMQIAPEQERLRSLAGELEARLGYAAFYSAWQRGTRHSLEETISLAGQVLEDLSERLGSVEPHASDPVVDANAPRQSLTGQAVDIDEALDEREREVLALAGEGLANRQIASRMGIADRTVKKHLTAAFRKLQAPNRVAAVAAARKLGIL